MMGVSKRDLFSVAGLSLGAGARYDFRDPLPELKPWPERVPVAFRAVTFKLLDGTELAITDERAYAALRKADEIILVTIPTTDADEVVEFRQKFQAWWRDLT